MMAKFCHFYTKSRQQIKLSCKCLRWEIMLKLPLSFGLSMLKDNMFFSTTLVLQRWRNYSKQELIWSLCYQVMKEEALGLKLSNPSAASFNFKFKQEEWLSFFHHQLFKIFFSSWFIYKNWKTVPVKINLFHARSSTITVTKNV